MKMTQSPMKSVTELRATLEAFAARSAALQIKQGSDPQHLLKQFTDLKRASDAGNYRRFATADRQLHQTIIELADVPGLKSSWLAAFEAQNTFRIKTLEQCWPDLAVLFESHRPLVDAIASGYPEEAEEEAMAHLDAVWFRLADATDDQSLPRDPLSRACAFLAFHFHEPIRLPELAQEVACCSPGHLARLFHDKLGLSFSDYLIELRMQKAAQLLQRSDKPIQEIARRLGYADPSRFTIHFRRRFGQPPREFRACFTRIMN
tara:strand:- start:1179 stop:1964 length:786 start_codon:yes stop_codon:yes gene_type:complete